MAFPVTTKYFLRWRHSDTTLSPTFTFCKRIDTLADVTPPTINNLGYGTYYFSYTFNSSADPGLVFEIDGGVTLLTEEERYIGDSLSARDVFLDDSISQARADIATVSTAVGTTNTAVAALSGVPASLSSISSAVSGLTAPDNAGIAAIRNKTDALPADVGGLFSSLSTQLVRITGLVHENSILDQTSFDNHNNLIAGRLRIFPSKNDLIEGTNLIATYRIEATYFEETSNVQEYKMTLESLG